MHDFLATIAGELPGLISMVAPRAGQDSLAVDLALNWSLRRKALAFDTVCRFRAAQHLAAHDPDLASKMARWRYLRQRLNDLPFQRQRQNEVTAASQKEIEDLRREADEKEADIHRALVERSPEHFRDDQEPDTGRVRASLPPGSALVEYLRLRPFDFKAVGKAPRWLPARYYAFVLTAGQDSKPRLFDLGPADDIDRAVRDFRAALDAFKDAWAAMAVKAGINPKGLRELEADHEKTLLRLGQALRKLTLDPLEGALGGAELLYVAADGPLCYVPFEALADQAGKYLIESRRFAYLTSGRDLLRPKAAPTAGTVVFAAPDFDLKACQRLELAKKILAGGRAGTLVGRQPGGGVRPEAGLLLSGWRGDLPGAAAAPADIEQALKGSPYGPVTAYAGGRALEEVFKAMPPPRLLHLATHGFYLDRAPEEPPRLGAGATWALGRLRRAADPLLRSGFVLAGANTVGDDGEAGAEDGWVTAAEVALRGLRGTELVVLGACQTALGDVKTGEGVFGLRRAFLYAGARTLITSQFEVSDAATRELMRGLYARLGKGEGKLQALRGAQLELLERRRAAGGCAHPFFWAGFVLVGDPD
jgi:CHAT domain-containing protein